MASLKNFSKLIAECHISRAANRRFGLQRYIDSMQCVSFGHYFELVPNMVSHYTEIVGYMPF